MRLETRGYIKRSVLNISLMSAHARNRPVGEFDTQNLYYISISLLTGLIEVKGVVQCAQESQLIFKATGNGINMIFKAIIGFVMLVISVAQLQPPFPQGQGGRQVLQPGQQFQGGQVQPGQLQPGQQFQPGQVRPGQQFQPVQPGAAQVQPGGRQFQPGTQQGQGQPGQPVSRGQQGRTATTRPQTPGQCVRQVQELTASCFVKAGFQLALVDAILTNGTIVPLPAGINLVEQRANLCNVRTQVIQCIIPQTLNLRGKPPCSDENEFTYAESQTVNRLSVLQSTCGAGGLTSSSECLQYLKQNMQQCHVKVGFDSDMFSSNSSTVRGAIIGRDRASAAKFCGSRSKLFDCMRNVIDSCPGAQEYMLLTGYDHNSMESSIELLCADVGVYVDGLACFQEPPQEVTECFDAMMSQMIELTAKQMENQVDKEKYMDEYCKIRVDHLQCDMKGWKKKCKEASVGLKNEHECTLLPGRCQQDPTLSKTLKQAVCNENSFARNLRAQGLNDNKNGAVSSLASYLVTITATVATVIFSLMI